MCKSNTFLKFTPKISDKNRNLSYRAQSPGERVHQIGPNIQLLHFSPIEQLSSEYLCPTLRATKFVAPHLTVINCSLVECPRLHCMKLCSCVPQVCICQVLSLCPCPEPNSCQTTDDLSQATRWHSPLDNTLISIVVKKKCYDILTTPPFLLLPSGLKTPFP